MIAKVVLEKYLAFSSGVLDYAVPKEIQSEIKIGQLVKVPFQKTFYHALIVGLTVANSKLRITNYELPITNDELRIKNQKKLKNIEQILCSEVLIKEEEILIAQEIADYYLCSIATVLKLFLPKNIWKNNVHKPKVITYFLNSKIDLSAQKIRGKNQLAILEFLKKEGKTTLEKIHKLPEYTAITLRGLIEKEFVIVEEKELFPTDLVTEVIQMKNLNQEQKNAFTEIINSKKPVLLHGITGSGKTEVYLHVIRNSLEKGRTALVLVPEIVLTTQIVDYFKNVFGDAVGVIHSKLSAGEKERIWWQIKLGQKKVIIGSRSALFYPFPKLGAIVLDEAHEWSYKSDQTPRYHAIKVAEILAKYYDAKLILGTATPRVEEYFVAKSSNQSSQEDLNRNTPQSPQGGLGGLSYKLISLKKRIYEDEIQGKKFTKESVLPEIRIIDLREEFKKKNFSSFSDVLIQELRQILANGEQALLFLNKRGTSSSVICRECGYVAKCKACDVGLTYHEKHGKGKLVCHYCGRMQNPLGLCPNCQSPQIKFVGVGTQKIERDLKQLFPTAKIARVDRDTTAKKDAHTELYTQLKNEELDIVIGTQIIAKGFDFPKVALVGILNADVGLNIPDFRSGEKVFHLLTQVGGRAGRRAKKGKVILQTHNPDNFIWQAVQRHDYNLFYENEIVMREELNWPPFSSVVKLTYVNYSIVKVLEKVEKLKKILLQITQNQDIQVLSAPALIPKIHNKYHWNIVLKGKNCAEIIRSIRLPVGWRVDRDPVRI